MRYQFRLETVMRVRRIGEQSARQNLALAVRDRHLAQEQLTEASEWCQTLPSPLGAFSIDTFLVERERVDRAVSAIGTAKARVQETTAVVEERTGIWQQARAQLRALERLDERRREEFALEESRVEAKSLDELSSVRWLRNNSPGADGFLVEHSGADRRNGSRAVTGRIGGWR
jgi:flagellar export protein FliJ